MGMTELVNHYDWGYVGDFSMQGVRRERRKKDLTEQGSHVKEVNFKKGMSLTWKNKKDLTPASTKR